MPVFEVTDPATGQTLELTGDSPPTEQELEQIFAANQPQQQPGFIDQAVGALEPLATLATGIVAEPVAGIAGIGAALVPGGLTGAEAVEATREALTFDPRTAVGKANLESIAGSEVVQAIGGAIGSVEKTLGDAGFDIAGPVGGAIGAAVPTAILEALGLAAPAAAGRVTQRLAKTAETRGARLAGDAEQLRVPATPEEGLKQVSETIKTGSQEDLARIVQPDPEFFKAADELNINVEPLASFGSQNPQFRALEQGLASIPASQLDAQGKAFIGELAQKADNLITEYGGTLDKAELSDRFRADSLAVIDDLGAKTDELYDTLGVRIPPSSRVEAINTVNFINQKAQELGGRKELPAVLNRVLRQLETTDKTGKPIGFDVLTGQPLPGKVTKKMPTHERLNQTRKEIGQAINRGTGPFKDQEIGLMKALYRRLREDQDIAAGQFGATEVSEAANALVRQRKHMEDNIAKLLGKDLEGSILPVVGQALKKLAKGDVQKWDSVMNRIPSKAVRQEIVVTALNDIFKGNNVQGKALNPTQFTKFMDDLDRSPATKNRLLKELPSESIKALKSLRTVSKGISIALQDKIPTGRVAAFFDDNDGLLRRLMGKALVLGITAKAGPLAASAAAEFINQTTDGAKSAASVLASTQFQNIMRTAVRDGVTEGAEISAKLKKSEQAFEKSKTFTRWAKALSDDDRLKLGSLGTVNYLLQDREGEQ